MPTLLHTPRDEGDDKNESSDEEGVTLHSFKISAEEDADIGTNDAAAAAAPTTRGVAVGDTE